MRAVLIGSNIRADQAQALMAKVRPSKYDLWMGVDGGTKVWFDLNLPPKFAVGDWDSLENAPHYLARVAHLGLDVNKDRSDLFFASKAALELGATEIVCLGVSGGMPDHHLAMLLDLSEISHRSKKLRSLEVLGLDGTYHFLSQNIPKKDLFLKEGTRVSFFALGGPASGVTLKGFQFPLKAEKLEVGSRGLSNRVLKERCHAKVKKGKIVVVVPHEKTKDPFPK